MSGSLFRKIIVIICKFRDRLRLHAVPDAKMNILLNFEAARHGCTYQKLKKNPFLSCSYFFPQLLFFLELQTNLNKLVTISWSMN